MLAGVRPFGGETVSEVLAATLKDELDYSRLLLGAPEPVRTLLRLSLRQDPAQRLQHAGDCRVLIDESLRLGNDADQRPGPAPDAGPLLHRFRIGLEICRRFDRLRLDPRLIGHELQYLDNDRRSDVL